MASGGARARSGPAPDPDSYRSQNREWIDLPAGGFRGEVPEFPFEAIPVYDIYWVDKERVKELDEDATRMRRDGELTLWADLWRKPQAHAWAALGLSYQVAAYVRAFIESTGPDSNAGLKTAALRMETELGISIAGMKQNLWRITGAVEPSKVSTAARKTSSGDWLKAVSVEGA